MQKRRLGATAAAAVLVLVLVAPVEAITWGPVMALTGSGTGYGYPGGLAASSTSVVHAIYEQGVLGSYRVHYRRSTNSGAIWSTALLLSRPSVGDAGAPAIEASGPTVDAVWVEGDDVIGGVDAVVIYRRSLDAGLTWEAPVVISPGLESAGYPRVARSGSRVEIVWTNEYSGQGLCPSAASTAA